MASGPSEIPLADVLALAAAGDGEAWTALVQSYTPRVFGLIVRQCGDRDLAEEITQQTFVKVVNQFASDTGYQEQGRFESWLFRIAINALRDELRRRRRHAQPLSATGDGRQGEQQWSSAGPVGSNRDTEQPIDRLTRQEQVEQLQQAMATLNENDREVLHLRHTAGLSFPQIAQTLDQPLGTVLARTHRAMKKLRIALDGRDGSGASNDGETGPVQPKETRPKRAGKP
jgi:RNA polymerase sigma-70 factor (ECF subfamily)